jgi:hypothetical protein
MNYSLPVKPSPNLPNDQAVNLYEFMPFEGTNVSVGVELKPISNLWLLIYQSDFSFTPKPNLGTKSCL